MHSLSTDSSKLKMKIEHLESEIRELRAQNIVMANSNKTIAILLDSLAHNQKVITDQVSMLNAGIEVLADILGMGPAPSDKNIDDEWN